jgi:Aspartyl protease
MIRASLLATVLLAANLLAEEPCSANVAVRASRATPNRHLVILQAFVNNAGPYDFLLDTGSQVTMIDQSLVSELKLQTATTAAVVGVSVKGQGGKYALVKSVRVGDSAKVESIYVLAFDMKDIRSAGYAIRGLIGEDFLSHFDVTIDHTHNRVCLTQTGQLSANAPLSSREARR